MRYEDQGLREPRDDEPWVSSGPGDGSLPRTEAVKDERVRRWDIATPSATLIGRAQSPDEDIPERLRRLHEERHPAMAGHSERMHRLDKIRIAHAVCSRLDLTPWERDRVLGLMAELDLTAFGSQRAIPTVTLVVVSHVVDRERQRQLGLHDDERLAELSADSMERLYELYDPITDDETYRQLLDQQELTTTNVNRLKRVLKTQIEEQDLDGAVLGRSPFRDPNLPAITDDRERAERPEDA
ncbi:DNA-directed RNA polymerase subunit epsilon [Halapricum hydrolyticum]|uniref:DNA-directed RNA polymerase subunit epsilon n=1 Tax=Halapricum hydrolyticum TaxID=2979991 RepID=A0AAE3LF28_9EURY|nr:DNA-directed RNA polymerase subunit epsilon [Halapricum hydrolyticum]MCU4717962.1 DNA-directed RNA polymerase subunit epsilon [Halapricum hydrolyticum]MCU4727127.1 DNA-directed RNA polymerase subunit epsilon [Halapricum hydrolyticum]